MRRPIEDDLLGLNAPERVDPQWVYRNPGDGYEVPPDRIYTYSSLPGVTMLEWDVGLYIHTDGYQWRTEPIELEDDPELVADKFSVTVTEDDDKWVIGGSLDTLHGFCDWWLQD